MTQQKTIFEEFLDSKILLGGVYYRNYEYPLRAFPVNPVAIGYIEYSRAK